MKQSPPLPIEKAAKIQNEEKDLQTNRIKAWISNVKSEWSQLFHWRIILLISVSIVYGWNSGVYFVTMPAHVKQHGIFPDKTAYIFMISAVANLATRLLGALIGNHNACFFLKTVVLELEKRLLTPPYMYFCNFFIHTYICYVI